MEDLDQRVLIAVAVGILTLLAILVSVRSTNGASGDGKDEDKPLASSSASKSAANRKKKQKRKEKKAGATPTETVLEPSPAPVEESTPAAPEPTSSQSKKKKKKKKSATPVEQPPAPTPVSEPTPALQEEPTTSTTKKNKKTKKKKQATETSVGVTPLSLPPVSGEENNDDDDDDFEQVARLISLKRGSKAPKQKTSPAAATTSAPSNLSQSKSKSNGTTATTNNNTTATATTSAEPSQPEITLNIGSDPAIIIGLGGSIIQNITNTSGARLDVLKNTPVPGQNVVRITATSEASIAQAMEMVQSLLDAEKQREANSISITLGPLDINGPDGVKAIIGKGGQTIKDIESRCEGVKINAQVDEGQVIVTGSKEMTHKAVTLCKQAVFGEAQATFPLVTRSAVNIVFGKDYATIRQIQTTTGAKLDIDKDTNVLKLSGKVESVTAAKLAITSLLARCQGVTLTLKAADVGAVYGKAGSNIRSIQDRTGAFVEVNQAIQGQDSATCSIMGEPAAVEEARKMILRAAAREVEVKPGQVAETMTLGSATPAVIGRGGTRVKELEKNHNVNLNVNSDSGTCRVVGKPEDVKNVKDAITAIVKPILAAETAKKQADLAAESGGSAWQGYTIPSDEIGW